MCGPALTLTPTGKQSDLGDQRVFFCLGACGAVKGMALGVDINPVKCGVRNVNS